jgi:hypothetical protein
MKLQLCSVLSSKNYVLADILGCGPLGGVCQLCCMLPPPPAERERLRERVYQLCCMPPPPPERARARRTISCAVSLEYLLCTRHASQLHKGRRMQLPSGQTHPHTATHPRAQTNTPTCKGRQTHRPAKEISQRH